MTKPHEEVKKEIYKHTCRNINLVYEAGKTKMTDQDEELLAAYIKLHDFELRMQKTADELYKESISVNKDVEAVRENLQKVKVSFDECSVFADKLSDTTYISEETSIEKLTEKQVQTNIEMQSHHGKMVKLYECIQLLERKLNDYNEANEDEMNNLYDEYSEVSVTHSSNWRNNSLNIVDFDKEYDDFHNYRSAYENRRSSLIDYCDTTLNNYSTLNLENTALYGVWDEFAKRCNLLRAVADLHGRVLGSNYN